MSGVAIGDQREILPCPTDASLAERYLEIIGHHGCSLCGIVKRLGFHKQRKASGTQAGAQQAGSVIGKRRINDACSGKVGQGAFQILGVIQSPADVSAGSQSQGHIGGKLPIGTPVFMGTFHVLIDTRPHVIGKLGSFNHNTDFRVKAAHSIGRSDDVIFGDGGIEYPG